MTFILLIIISCCRRSFGGWSCGQWKTSIAFRSIAKSLHCLFSSRLRYGLVYVFYPSSVPRFSSNTPNRRFSVCLFLSVSVYLSVCLSDFVFTLQAFFMLSTRSIHWCSIVVPPNRLRSSHNLRLLLFSVFFSPEITIIVFICIYSLYIFFLFLFIYIYIYIYIYIWIKREWAKD